MLLYLVTWIAAGLVTASAATPQRAPTFADDVAPILYAHCVTCHRPGQAAASTLLSYEDARARAGKIVEVTAARTMPPWSATQPEGFVSLRDDRRLSNSQLTTLRRWAEAGAPPGDLRRLPVPPAFPNVWRTGIPDLVLTLPRPVTVPAAGRPFIRNVTLPIDLPIDRWITAIDFQPSTRDVTQLAAFFIRPADATAGADAVPGLALAIDQAKTAPSSTDIREPLDPSWGGLTRWVPGLMVRQFPENTALRLPSHSNLVVQLHLRPADQAQSEDGRVAVYFSSVPPVSELTGIQLPPAFGYGMGIEIPPGANRYLVRDTFELPVEVDAYAVRAHGRDVARGMTLTARPPGRQTARPLADRALGSPVGRHVFLQVGRAAAARNDPFGGDSVRQLRFQSPPALTSAARGLGRRGRTGNGGADPPRRPTNASRDGDVARGAVATLPQPDRQEPALTM